MPTVRDFLNAILGFVGASTLTDLEFSNVTVVSPFYDLNTYENLRSVLISRESVSSTLDRLQYFFLAKGFEFGPTISRSNIFVGGVIE